MSRNKGECGGTTVDKASGAASGFGNELQGKLICLGGKYSLPST